MLTKSAVWLANSSMYEIADRRRLRAIVEEHGLVLNGPLYSAVILELPHAACERLAGRGVLGR